MPAPTRRVLGPHRASTPKIVMHENATKCTASRFSPAHLIAPALRATDSAKQTHVPTRLTSPRPKPRQRVLNNSAQSLSFESFITRRSLGLEIGGGCSAAAGAVSAESISGGLGHG